MRTPPPASPIDRTAQWILRQSWPILGGAAALVLVVSSAVASMVPANLVKTSLLGELDSPRHNYTEMAVAVGPVAQRAVERPRTIGSLLKAQSVGECSEWEPWNCSDLGPVPTPEPVPAEIPTPEATPVPSAEPTPTPGVDCALNPADPACLSGSTGSGPVASPSPKPSPEEKGTLCYKCENDRCVQSVVPGLTCPPGSSPDGCGSACVYPMPGIVELRSPQPSPYEPLAPTPVPTEGAAPTPAAPQAVCCSGGGAPDFNGFCPDGGAATAEQCGTTAPTPEASPNNIGASPVPSATPSTVGQDCSVDTDCGDPNAGWRCGGFPGNKRCVYDPPTPASSGAQCQSDADCPPSAEHEYECISISGGASTCQPLDCEEDGGQQGFNLLRLLANEVFVRVNAQQAGGLPRSQPCYRALLARIANGSLQCDPADAARCAQDGGQGCFKNPTKNSQAECFVFSNANNPCLNPDGSSMSCPNGMTCSPCFGGCVKVSDFCNEQQCASTGGTCSHITLSCVPNANSSCQELCGRAGLSCVGYGQSAQCIQDRCTGRQCPNGQACDMATGQCSGGGSGIVTDACALFDAIPPAGYECVNVDAGDGVNKKAEFRKVGSATDKIAFDPCDKTIPTNRDCPPETICVNVNGYAECKLPPNSACDSFEQTSTLANDCINGAVCRRNATTGVGQCVANYGTSSSNQCNDTDKKCPDGMRCDAGLCKVNRSECTVDADCKAAGLGLKICRTDTANNIKRCGYPDGNADGRPDISPCYLVDILNNARGFGLSTSEILEISVLLQGQKCERAAGTVNDPILGTYTASGASFNVNPAGLPGLVNANGVYRFPVPGSLSGVGGRTGSGSTGGGGTALANVCSTPITCSKVGEVAFKKNNPNSNAAEQCECRTPTLADYANGVAPIPMQMCSNERPLRRTGIYAGADGSTKSSDNFADLNTGQEGAAKARESLNLPCFASEYSYVNGVLTAKGTYVFCGDSTTDVTGCAQITTDGSTGYPTARYVGGAGCDPTKPKACNVDLEALKAAAVPDGGECPVPPTLTRAPVMGMVPSNYETTALKFQATLAAGTSCTMAVSDFCAGVAPGTTVSIKWSDFAKPDAYCNGSNCVTASDGKKYTYGRGNLWPVGCTQAGGSSGGGILPTPAPTPAGLDSTRLALCPDATEGPASTQCKYPIHPWYNVRTRNYPQATSDRLYSAFGGGTSFVPASGCWTIAEYVPRADNSAWGANLTVALDPDARGFWSGLWNWILSLFGAGDDNIGVAVTFPDGKVLKAAVPPECLENTKIGIGQTNRTGSSAGTGVNSKLPQCRALLGLDTPTTSSAGSTDSTERPISSPLPGTDAGLLSAYTPPVIPGRRYYAVPTCSGAAPSPISPIAPSASPTPRVSASPAPTATATGCGANCPSGQCKEIAGFGPFCVTPSWCSEGPDPCPSGNSMCVTNDGQWSCTSAALRPAGATCVTCGGASVSPTPTSGATPRPSASPSPTATPRPSASATPVATPANGLASLSITMPDAGVIGTPLSLTVCAKDVRGTTLSSYRGTIVFYIAEDTPVSAFDSLPRYTFTAADNGCHRFERAITLQYPGVSTVVAVDVDYASSVYGIKVVNGSRSASPTPTPTASPRVDCSLDPAHPDCAGIGGTPTPVSSGSPRATPTPTPQPSACPADLRQCPDGSRVGRVLPGCQFAECPTGNANSNAPVACAQDAKICPDGSVVGRVAPDCRFPECPGALGDVNGDGRVTIADLAMVLDSLTGVRGVTLTPEQVRRADVNCDRRLNLADVAKLANFIVTGGSAPSRVLTCSGS